MSAGLTLVIAPLSEELSSLRRRVVIERRVRLKGACHLTLGHLRGRPIALGILGDGRRRAERNIRVFLSAQPFARLLVIGVAGGLSPGLQIGDLAVAREIRSLAGARFEPDSQLFEAALRLCPDAVPATGITTGGIALSEEERKKILREVAEGASVFADLESSIIAEAAASARLPYLVVRAMSDTPERPLPDIIAPSMDDGGAVRRDRVIMRALFRPSAWRQLATLGRIIRGCSNRLADAVEGLEACASS
jgi:adenosylhomocysteine nucleosidase